METNFRTRTLLWCMPVLTFGLGFSTMPCAAGTTANGILGITPVFENTCIAVAVHLEEGQAVDGLRWYNNDASTVFPAVMAVAGYTETAPDLIHAVVIVEDVAGSEDGWSDLVFEQAVVSPTNVFYFVFVLPPNEQAVERGNGPGIGYAVESGGSEAYLSAEGVEWLPMVTDKRLLVEPVLSDAGAKSRKQLLVLPAPSGEAVGVNGGTPDAVVISPTALLPVFPNPFNPQTTIAYELDSAGDVEIAIYDIRGRLVKRFGQEWQEPGYHEVVWGGEDDGGRRIASGVYLVKMRAAGYTGRTRVVLLR